MTTPINSDHSPEQRVKLHASEEPLATQPSSDEALFAHKVAAPPTVRIDPIMDPIKDWKSHYWEPHRPPVVTKLSCPPSHKRADLKIQIQRHGQPGYKLDVQGDSGANTSASNDLDILWGYTQFAEPMPLATYSEGTAHSARIHALGEGYIRMILQDESVIDFPALYVPNATGIIISPDQYMRRNEHIHHWIQEASKYEGGFIHFLNKNKEVEATLNMRSKHGLWFATNPIYVRKPTASFPSIKTVTLPTIFEDPFDPSGADWDDTSNPWGDHTIQNLIDLPPIPLEPSETPSDRPPDPPGLKPFEVIHDSWTSHINLALSKMDDQQPSQAFFPAPKQQAALSQNLKHLELWHQRMGHIHPRTLVETSKHVEGMPSIPTNAPYFRCPFCEKAKLRKQNRKKVTSRESLLPGSSFHMDFGFISGPPNLPEMVNKGMKAKPGLCQDRHGNTAYLLIICAKTRYIWGFPLRSKQPPIGIIDQFLRKHGRAHGRNITKITTSPDGILSKSRSFNRLIKTTHKLAREDVALDIALDLDFDNGATPKDELPTTMEPVEPTIQQNRQEMAATIDDPSLHRYTIRTDQGGELARSTEFSKTCMEKHGYIVEATGPDASSQNGMAERPNRTLKERVRCLLYTAGLGTEFWSDALLHAIWLYNRTYHRGIETTPFEAWTGRRPFMADVLTFGTKLTAKVPGKRQPALVPHHYDGIFLGYSGTMSKVRYWNIANNNEKTAHHAEFDELHYGANPSSRPPAARHLIEVFTGSPHSERSSHNLKEPPATIVNPTNSSPISNEQIINDSPLSAHTWLPSMPHKCSQSVVQTTNWWTTF